jgi:hypothetical protein
MASAEMGLINAATTDRSGWRPAYDPLLPRR